ncbi:MAG: 4,5-DOPA dioxygenase extradiol [Acidimicrobiales bacterium]
MSDAPLPVVFVGHGSPMNTLEQNRYTEAWAALGATLPRPRAVLAISAHWYTNATAVTAMTAPRTIHDFFGFPDRLFAYEYPCPGAPEVAAEVAEVVEPRWVGLDHDSWGIDHGTWSVLAHMYPDADVPVVQLAINALQPLDYHLDIATRLAPLRARGVLIVASGNVVHNLGAVDWSHADAGFDWARRFDEAARSVVVDSPGDVLTLTGHPDYALAVPTPDHFIPLLYFAGVAAADSARQPEVLIDGYAYGSLSMTCYSA